MKRFNLLLLVIFISYTTQTKIFSQTISTHFAGINAWMPDTIGDASKNSNCIFNGKLHKSWGAIKTSGSKLVRYGGIAADQNKPTNYQYIRVIDSIRAIGLEPILQVPFYNNKFTASEAAEIVRYINIVKKKKVKYWIIGNEPDLSYNYTNSSQVASYIKKFSSAMKTVDPSILIIGPETAWYNRNILIGLTNPGGADDITGKDAAGRYYIDVISFHTYPFNGSQTRSSVIHKLTEANSFEDNLSELNSRIGNCNKYHQRTASTALKIAVTEANVNYLNSATDNLYGAGANSFIGGQFIAEMMCIAMKKNVDFMCIWSVIEGNNTSSNIGLLDRTNSNKKSAFYHFKMVSDHFKGIYCNGTDNIDNVKSFGCKNDKEISVLIMNQDESKDLNYTVRLNDEPVSGTDPLKINISAGISKQHKSTISSQSTILLVFDPSGNIIKKNEYKLSGDADANQPVRIINAPNAFITSSGSTSFCTYENVTLNAPYEAGYKYQWKKDGTDIPGATESAYIASKTGKYSVLIENSGLYATSNAININVIDLSANITTTGTVTFCSGGKVLLKTDSLPGRAYQWRKDNIAISGANNSTYAATKEGNYSVKITEKGCNAWSAPLTVTPVNPAIPSVYVTGETSFCESGSVLFKTDSTAGRTYQWRRDGVGIYGATNASYKASLPGSYSVKITENGCNAWSAPIPVTTYKLSATVKANGPTIFPMGGNVILSANTGYGYSFQWRKGGIAIPGANASTYKATSSGEYSVKIYEGTCVAWSASLRVYSISKAQDEIIPKYWTDGEETPAPISVMDDDIASARILDSAQKVKESFEVKVYPNPSQNNFFMIIQGIQAEQTLINVFDMQGNTCIANQPVSYGQENSFGKDLRPGCYIVEIIQGNRKKSLKLIKN